MPSLPGHVYSFPDKWPFGNKALGFGLLTQEAGLHAEYKAERRESELLQSVCEQGAQGSPALRGVHSLKRGAAVAVLTRVCRGIDPLEQV